jgi:hypothetical protein
LEWRGAGSPGARRGPGRRRSASTAGPAGWPWCGGGPRGPVWKVRRGRPRGPQGCMRPVEQPHRALGNPGASLCLPQAGARVADAAAGTAGASGAGARRGAGVHAGCTDSGLGWCAWRDRGPGLSRFDRSRSGRGHSGCIAGPGCGSGRSGTCERDGPCAPGSKTEGAGRNRPRAPHCGGTSLRGTVQGAAWSPASQASGAVAAPICFGIGCVVAQPGGQSVIAPGSPTDAGGTRLFERLPCAIQDPWHRAMSSPAWPPSGRPGWRTHHASGLRTSMLLLENPRRSQTASSPPDRRGFWAPFTSRCLRSMGSCVRRTMTTSDWHS